MRRLTRLGRYVPHRSTTMRQSPHRYPKRLKPRQRPAEGPDSGAVLDGRRRAPSGHPSWRAHRHPLPDPQGTMDRCRSDLPRAHAPSWRPDVDLTGPAQTRPPPTWSPGRSPLPSGGERAHCDSSCNVPEIGCTAYEEVRLMVAVPSVNRSHLKFRRSPAAAAGTSYTRPPRRPPPGPISPSSRPTGLSANVTE